jgi:DNA polymerase-1
LSDANVIKCMNRILIVDGHAYAYRAFYAIRSLSAPDGRPTNAIYGFVKMLEKMRDALQPSHLVVVWDGGLSGARMEALPGYKAQRPEMPAALAEQLPELDRYLMAANIATYQGDGVEADDYIAAVALAASASGMFAVIASADKDFMQLVRPGIGLLNPNDKSETIWGAEQVTARTGVAPEQIVDWLSLLGDSVDNIPGVPGVGPKTAADLLRQFGSVDELYLRLPEVKSERIRKALQNGETEVRRNQALVRLQPEVGGKVELAAFAVRSPDRSQLAELYRVWGFRSLRAELLGTQVRQPELI